MWERWSKDILYLVEFHQGFHDNTLTREAFEAYLGFFARPKKYPLWRFGKQGEPACRRRLPMECQERRQQVEKLAQYVPRSGGVKLQCCCAVVGGYTMSIRLLVPPVQACYKYASCI